MIEYFLTFVIVIFLTFLAQCAYKSNKLLSYLFAFISICVLSLMAAFRSLDVGTDIKVYGATYFEACGNFTSIFSYVQFYENEPLYFIINYIVYFFTQNIHVFFFVLQFIIASIVYIIAYRNIKNDNMIFYIIAYLFLWYNTSFNILRQSLAVFVILYAFKYIENKKYIKYCIAVCIASLFHSSAIICFTIPILAIIARSKYRYLYTAITIILIYVILININTVAIILNQLKILPDKYLIYLAKDGNFIWYFEILKICMLIIITVFLKKSKDRDSNNILYIILIFDIVLYSVSYFVKYGYRISYYFLPHMILLLPRIETSLKDSKGKNTYRLAVIVMLIVYWIVRYAIIKYDGTLPYIFYWES